MKSLHLKQTRLATKNVPRFLHLRILILDEVSPLETDKASIKKRKLETSDDDGDKAGSAADKISPSRKTMRKFKLHICILCKTQRSILTFS